MLEKKKFEMDGMLKVGKTQMGVAKLEGFLNIGDKSYFIDIYKKSAEVLEKYPSDWTHSIKIKEKNKQPTPVKQQDLPVETKPVVAKYVAPVAQVTEDIPF